MTHCWLALISMCHLTFSFSPDRTLQLPSPKFVTPIGIKSSPATQLLVPEAWVILNTLLLVTTSSWLTSPVDSISLDGLPLSIMGHYTRITMFLQPTQPKQCFSCCDLLLAWDAQLNKNPDICSQLGQLKLELGLKFLESRNLHINKLISTFCH